MNIKSFYAAEDARIGRAVQWPMPRRKKKKKRGGGFCPEYGAVYSAFAVKPSGLVAAKQNAMIKTIADSGAWAVLDWFVCLAGETETESRLDWVTLVKTCDDVGAGNAWTTMAGIQGNGNGSLDSNFTPSTDGTHIGLNDVSYGFYSNLTPAGADQVEMACHFNVSDINVIYSMANDNKAYVKLHSSAAYLSAAVANRKGCYIANKVAVDTTQLWKNNVKIIDAAQATYASKPNTTVRLLSMGDGIASRSTNQISLAFAGKGLTVAQIAAITSAFNTYMT
jgi:hypothetical protein